jgi:hypothetical protein
VARTRRNRFAGLLAVVAALAVALGHELPASSSSPTTVAPPAARTELRGDALDPGLRHALREARAAASVDGVKLTVGSGRRTPEHQERLLREAVAKYGSEEEAARWVATPETSAHVSGDAVDIGPAGAAWLSEHGAAYGLCRIYDNEPWHFELRPEARDDACPPTYPDPTYDPRMRP